MLGKCSPFVAVVAAVSLAAGGCASSSPPAAGRVDRAAATARVTTVVAVSVDGLNPAAIHKLGRDRAPTLHRLIDRGAASLNARTEREQTNTLPNHTGMITGRRVNPRHGGHGVTWNDDRDGRPTVHQAAGERVSSVFSVVHAAGKATALFASKPKFSLFDRSWPKAIDKYVEESNNRVLVDRLLTDLAERRRAFRFVHLSAPDGAGHAHGFMSPEYLDAVAATDRRIGRIIRAIQRNDRLARHTAVIVTADHGGSGAGHRDPTRLANFRVPFLVWGAGVQRGAALYSLNPDYRNPRTRRTTYRDRRQPIRNGAVANLATDLLRLRAIPGSEHDADQDLDVRRR